MSTVIEKIYGVVDSHDEDGDCSGEGAWARTDVVVAFKMNGRQSNVYYVHEYIMTEDGPAESTPDEFENRTYEDTWQEKC